MNWFWFCPKANQKSIASIVDVMEHATVQWHLQGTFSLRKCPSRANYGRWYSERVHLQSIFHFDERNSMHICSSTPNMRRWLSPSVDGHPYKREWMAFEFNFIVICHGTYTSFSLRFKSFRVTKIYVPKNRPCQCQRQLTLDHISYNQTHLALVPFDSCIPERISLGVLFCFINFIN